MRLLVRTQVVSFDRIETRGDHMHGRANEAAWHVSDT